MILDQDWRSVVSHHWFLQRIHISRRWSRFPHLLTSPFFWGDKFYHNSRCLSPTRQRNSPLIVWFCCAIFSTDGVGSHKQRFLVLGNVSADGSGEIQQRSFCGWQTLEQLRGEQLTRPTPWSRRYGKEKKPRAIIEESGGSCYCMSCCSWTPMIRLAACWRSARKKKCKPLNKYIVKLHTAGMGEEHFCVGFGVLTMPGMNCNIYWDNGILLNQLKHVQRGISAKRYFRDFFSVCGSISRAGNFNAWNRFLIGLSELL